MKIRMWIFVGVMSISALPVLADLVPGRLVAVSDEWCLGDYFNTPGNDGAIFATNTFNWLTAPSGNRAVLIDSQYAAHDLTPLISTLDNEGFSVTESDPITWNSATFGSYGAVLWERGHGDGINFDGSQLTNYIQAGGGVLVLSGGDDVDTPQHNNLLNACGINESLQQNGLYTVTQFTTHPVTDGVSSIMAYGPGPLTLLPGSRAVVLSQEYGINWILAYTANILGDVNYDGVLNFLDIDAIYQHLTVAPPGYVNWPRPLVAYNAQYDVNGDGVVSQDDVTYELNHYFLTNYGDANLDKATDFVDFQALLNNWQANGSSIGWAQGDFNGDGTVDFLDFQVLLNYWNPAGWNFAPSETPEPASLSLLALGVVVILRRRK
jgi:hypothetical protein